MRNYNAMVAIARLPIWLRVRKQTLVKPSMDFFKPMLACVICG